MNYQQNKDMWHRKQTEKSILVRTKACRQVVEWGGDHSVKSSVFAGSHRPPEVGPQNRHRTLERESKEMNSKSSLITMLLDCQF